MQNVSLKSLQEDKVGRQIPPVFADIYQWHLPVFTGLENTPQVANTSKYRQIEIFLALKNCRSL